MRQLWTALRLAATARFHTPGNRAVVPGTHLLSGGPESTLERGIYRNDGYDHSGDALPQSAMPNAFRACLKAGSALVFDSSCVRTQPTLRCVGPATALLCRALLRFLYRLAAVFSLTLQEFYCRSLYN